MKKLLFSAVLLLSIALTSCNKNQAVVKDLEGEWNMTGLTVNGTAAPASEYQGTYYTFQVCKVKNEDCSGSLNSGDPTKGTISFPFTYNITDDGKKFNLNLNLLGTISKRAADVIEQSDSKFVFEYTQTDTDSTGATVTEKVRETLTKR
jgi:hypothetical protein